MATSTTLSTDLQALVDAIHNMEGRLYHHITSGQGVSTDGVGKTGDPVQVKLKFELGRQYQPPVVTMRLVSTTESFGLVEVDVLTQDGRLIGRLFLEARSNGQEYWAESSVQSDFLDSIFKLQFHKMKAPRQPVVNR